MTAAESSTADHQGRPIKEHFDAFDKHLRAKAVTRIHREDTGRYLERLAADCGFNRLADLRSEALEGWLADRARDGMSARTRNAYRDALVSFCNWCAKPTVGRLTRNPFLDIPRADEKADPRRQRRSMDEPELVKLLAVARDRPLLDALTVRKGPRRGERYANVRPEVRERLELLGRERALTYKTLVLTGLRKGELASLTVAHLRLDEPVPYLTLTLGMRRTGKGTTSPCGMTSPRTFRTGSPTSCAGYRLKPSTLAFPFRPAFPRIPWFSEFPPSSSRSWTGTLCSRDWPAG